MTETAGNLGTTMFSGHKHTNRSLPINNKICNQRWVDRCQQLHRMRLNQIKPAIDNKPPTRYKHPFQNLKKAQLEDERNMEIERENRLLLEKMSMIMESGRPEMASANTTEFVPGTRIDRHQYPMVDHYKKLDHKSLNKEARRRELLRITADNQAILKRIQERQPFYNHLEWERERLQNEKYLRNISQFPESLPSLDPTETGGAQGDVYGAAPEMRSLPEPLFSDGADGGAVEGGGTD